MISEFTLNQKARFFAKYLWNKELTIPVIINKRFRSTHGRFTLINIELAPHILEHELLADDTLLHELCHWYCHSIGEEYHDHTKFFENELERIGASSTYSTQDDEHGRIMYRYRYGYYECKNCQRSLETRDYLDVKIEGQIGTPFKKYYCCDEQMKFTGAIEKLEPFEGNEKLHKIREAFHETLSREVVLV